MDWNDVNEEDVTYDLRTLETTVEDVFELLRQYEHREAAGLNNAVAGPVQERLDRYAETAEDIWEAYEPGLKVTVDRHHADYRFQQRVSEKVDRIANYTHYLQEFADTFPDVPGLDDRVPEMRR